MEAVSEKMIRKELRRQRRDARRALNEPPARSILEEIGNAVTHGLGALTSVWGLVALLLKAKDAPARLAAAVYGGCLVLLFTMSCLYHAFRQGTRVKRVWRRFDYCSIYLLIGGSFAPLFLVWLGGRTGLILFCAQWAVIAAGITFVAVFGPVTLKKLHYTLYLVLGWSALFLLPGIYRTQPQLLWWLLAGGVGYTAGIIPFALKTRGSHFLWHLFVLLGAALHYFGYYRLVF